MVDTAALAPGARVLIRDAEWIVKRRDKTGTGGYSLLVVGVSEIVRNREARFLTEIARDAIQALDPVNTQLVSDASPQFRNTRLYLESLLRQSPPTGADLWIGHQAAIDDLPFQLDPALTALEQPRHRILMADGVGLGKTIEIGVLLAELIKRGKGKRILAVTTKSMMAQFQKELWSRFTIPLVRLDSVGLERIRSRIPTNANPFHYFDKIIISIDTLKQNNEFRVYLERSYWDVIVIDEAHNVAARGSTRSLRNRLAELLARKSDTLIMASATPHDGRAASFASLMNMLNPTAIADPENYTKDDIRGLFLRRFKKDVQAQIAGSFLERQVTKHPVAASAAEERVYSLLADLTFRSFDKARRSGQLLFKTVLEKALFSSPQACLETVRQRLKRIENKTGPDVEHDRRALQRLAAALEALTPADFAKYRKLLELLRPGGELDWNPAKANDRLVIFTERIETLRFLQEHLRQDLGLAENQIETISGTEKSDVEIQEAVEKFGRDREPVRLLLASDVASEGLNLHFLCHKLIHFDIPWSLMVFQQRNGRIDRYGQERPPRIAYLYTEPSHPRIRGDLRILELLIEKDEQARKNIGDPSAFQGVYDAQQEEIVTGKAIEDGVPPEDYDRRMEETASQDPLTVLFGDEPAPAGESAKERCRSLPRLFRDDLDYVQTALTALERDVDLQAAFDRSRRQVAVTVNEELEQVFRALPPDVVPPDRRIVLTTDRRRVMEAIKRCRGEERAWPDVHLLWDLHPIMEWLNYKLMVLFGRSLNRRRERDRNSLEAPVMRLEGTLAPGRSLFLIQGEIPNRKGQPVIHEWFAAEFDGQRFAGYVPLEAFLRRTRLREHAYPNRGPLDVPPAIQGLVAEAIDRARAYMSEKRRAFEAQMRPRLDEELSRLEKLCQRQQQLLDLKFPEDGQLAGVRLNRKQKKRRSIEKTFDEWKRWVKDTMETEDQPYLRVAAVFIG